MEIIDTETVWQKYFSARTGISVVLQSLTFAVMATPAEIVFTATTWLN